jgi:hypothetical protein
VFVLDLIIGSQVILHRLNILLQARAGAMYRPVYHHWFFRKEIETKVLWQPFSMVDSLALEEAFISSKYQVFIL